MPAKRITIRDVAKKANVSIKTVSNVINDRDDQMRPGTKSRVERVIKELGYQVNRSARALKTGKTKVLGLAMPDFDQPFIGFLVNAFNEAAHRRGYATVSSLFGFSTDRRRDFADSIPRINADGWAYLFEEPFDSESPLFQQNVPLVLISDYSSAGMYDIIAMPNTESCQYLTNTLFDQGCSSIGFIGAPESLCEKTGADEAQLERTIVNATDGNSILRLKGYALAHLQHKKAIPWNLIIPTKHITSFDGVTATYNLLRNRVLPDAVICVNDAVAMGVVSTLARNGISIPEQIRICGFDNIPESEISAPPLTTINFHIEQFAQLTVDALVSRINGNQEPANTFTSSFNLIERESTKGPRQSQSSEDW